MKLHTAIRYLFVLLTGAFFLGDGVQNTYAQYGYPNQYGGGYNQGGYNQGGIGGSRMGGNRFGGGGLGGGYGGGGYGGGMSSSRGGYSGGMGMSSMGGGLGGGMSGRGSTRGSSRGSSRSSGMGGYNTGYNTGYGNNQGAAASSRGRGRSFGDVGQSLGGSVPQTAGGQANVGQPGQTAPTGRNTDRSKAFNQGARGGANGSSEGGIQVQGSGPGAGNIPGSSVPRPAGQPQAQQQRKPEIKLRASATLYLDSNNQLNKLLNEPFFVDVLLSNPQNTGFNEIAFAVKYNPDLMTPIEYAGEGDAQLNIAEKISIDGGTAVASSSQNTGNLPTVQSFIQKKKDRFAITKNTIDSDSGIIQFAARVQNETSTDSGLIARVHFMPRKEAENARLSFLMFDPDIEEEENKLLTRLTLNDEDRLGTRYDPTDGITNLSLSIFESMEKVRDRPVVRSQETNRFGDQPGETDYDTRIILIPREEIVDVGDIVNVDVYLSNPGEETIDSISLLIAFNPDIFVPLDSDEYQPGININDQDYKDKFPLDFPMVNAIEEDRGIIDFRKQAMRAPIRNEGIFATFRLRAVQPTNKTTFRVFLSETGEAPTTGVFYRGQDRLGDPSDPFDGVETASIMVRPTTAYLKRIEERLRKG